MESVIKPTGELVLNNRRPRSVKIIKSSFSENWYKNLVGNEYKVKEYIRGGNTMYIEDVNQRRRMVFVDDVEFLDEIK